MSKKCAKNAFYFYKQKFEKENNGKIFDKGITDIDVAALESWRVVKKSLDIFAAYSNGSFIVSENDTATT